MAKRISKSKLIAEMRLALARLPEPLSTLKLKFQDGDDTADGSLTFVGEDGREHVSYLQMGSDYAILNTSIWKAEREGDILFWEYVGVRHGRERNGGDEHAIAQETAGAIAEEPKGFGPMLGSGVSTHPWGRLLMQKAAEAVKTAGVDLKLALSSNDAAAPGEDVVRFRHADGAEAEVIMSTMPGGIRAFALEGATFASAYADKAAKVAEVVASVATELSAAPQPSP